MRTKYLAAAGLLATSSLGVAIVQTGSASASDGSCQTSSVGTLCFNITGSGLSVNSFASGFAASTKMKGYMQIGGPSGQSFFVNSNSPVQAYNAGTSNGYAVSYSPAATVPAGTYCAAFYEWQGGNSYSLTNLTCAPVFA
jgi:hypothetical protein